MAKRDVDGVPKSVFLNPTRARNFPLIVENQKLWVSKETLAEHSPVFEKIFYDESFADSSKPEIELPGKTVDEMTTFFEIIFPTPVCKSVDLLSCNILAKLADEYDAAEVKRQCYNFVEIFLTTRIPIMNNNENAIIYLSVLCSNFRFLKDFLPKLVVLAAGLPQEKIVGLVGKVPNGFLAAVYQAKCNALSIGMGNRAGNLENRDQCFSCYKPARWPCSACNRFLCDKCKETKCPKQNHSTGCSKQLAHNSLCACLYTYSAQLLENI